MNLRLFRPYKKADAAPTYNLSSKNEVGQYLTLNGFDPAEFVFSYLPESNYKAPIGASGIRRCRYDDLPADFECLLFRTRDGAITCDYNRYRNPAVQRAI